MMGVQLLRRRSLQWFRNALCAAVVAEAKKKRVDAYELLTAEAAAMSPGSNGLFFLPYLSGERTPHADPDARGSFIGLTLSHERGHMVRAIMEGVTYSMRDSLAIFEGLDVPIKQIRASGGGARSPLWRQIQADAFGRKVVTINSEEGPAYGVALLAVSRRRRAQEDRRGLRQRFASSARPRPRRPRRKSTTPASRSINSCIAR